MSERLDLEALERDHQLDEDSDGCRRCIGELYPCDAALAVARVHELEAALRRFWDAWDHYEGREWHPDHALTLSECNAAYEQARAALEGQE